MAVRLVGGHDQRPRRAWPGFVADLGLLSSRGAVAYGTRHYLGWCSAHWLGERLVLGTHRRPSPFDSTRALRDDAWAGRGRCQGARAFDPPEEPVGRTTGEVGVVGFGRPSRCGSAAQDSARPLLWCCSPGPGSIASSPAMMTSVLVPVGETVVINQ